MRKAFGKKKKSPLNRAWSELKRMLPEKKSRRKSKLSVEKLRMKRFSLTADKKVSTALKRLSLNVRKDSFQNGSAGRKEKDRGGLGRVGGQIKNPFCQDNKKAGDASKEENQDKKKLKKIVRLNWSKGSKANREIP